LKSLSLKRLFIILTLSLSQLAICQDDLDEIFDDGMSNRHLRIGSDASILAGGTVAAFLDYHPKRELSYRIGAGLMPFGYQIDLSNINKAVPVFDNSVNVGYFLQASFAFHYKFCWNQPFDIYHLIGIERWQFNADHGFNVKRTKVEALSVGFGFDLGLKGRIDTRFGIFAGIDKSIRNLNENSESRMFRGHYYSSNTYQRDEILTGMDASFEVSFKL